MKTIRCGVFILANSTKLCYNYDSLNRVTKRTIKNLTDTVLSEESFTYDAAGNLTGGSADTAFAYDTNNRLTSFNGKTVSYDLDGNMLSNGSASFTYDSGNRLTAAAGHTYTYNAENLRIRNLCADENTTYTYNTNCKLSQLLCKTTGGVVTKYVYGGGLIGEESNGIFKTYHFDCRGSTVAITDASGNITDTFAYDTYGKQIARTGTSAVIFGFNGRDGVVTEPTGLVYMRARYYSPDMRRFINADIVVGGISNANTLNRYAYANGNPVSNIDPFGLFSLLGWARDTISDVGAAIGGMVSDVGNMIGAAVSTAGAVLAPIAGAMASAVTSKVLSGSPGVQPSKAKQDISSAVGNAVSGMTAEAGSVIGNSISSVGTIAGALSTAAGNAVGEAIYTTGNMVNAAAYVAGYEMRKAAISIGFAIADAATNTATWVDNNIVQPVGEAARYLGTQIKDGFNAAVTAISDNIGATASFGKEVSQKFDYYFFGSVETGFGYNKDFGNEKPVNLYVSGGENWWEFWKWSVGLDIKINGYGAGIGIGSDTSISIHCGDFSHEVGSVLGGTRLYYKQAYKEDGAYAYTKKSFNLPETALVVVGVAAAVYFGGPVAISALTAIASAMANGAIPSPI